MPEAEPRQLLLIDEFRQMLEEWRVSLFAQELGTSMPVSAKRLRAKLNGIEASGRAL